MPLIVTPSFFDLCACATLAHTASVSKIARTSLRLFISTLPLDLFSLALLFPRLSSLLPAVPDHQPVTAYRLSLVAPQSVGTLSSLAATPLPGPKDLN
jgi:hypothetical protein